MKKAFLRLIYKYKSILPSLIIIFLFSFIAGYLRYKGFNVLLNTSELAKRLENPSFLVSITIVIIFFSFYIKTLFLYLENYLRKYPILFGLIVSLTIFLLGLGSLRVSQLMLFTLIILLFFTILFILNYFIFKLTPKQPDLITEKELATSRTSETIEKIHKYLSKKSIQTIQMDGDWGSGKTHILKTLYNNLRSEEESKYIPIYIPLDQINSTDTFISRFKKNLNQEIFSLSGYKSSLELSHIIREFYQKNHFSLSQIMSLFIDNEPSTFKDLNKLYLLKDKKVLAIIDDCDRILTTKELKFVLEFILYLRNYSKNFKIIFSANSKQISPFIGYSLIKSYGEIDADLLDSLAEIANNTQEKSNSITRILSAGIDNSSIIALGDLYLDKFRDIQVLISSLPDKSLTEIFLKQLQPITSSKEIDLDKIRDTLMETPLPFGGDFRLMKRLLALLTNIELSTVKEKDLDMYEIILLGFYYVNTKRKLTKEVVRYLQNTDKEPYFQIEERGRREETISGLINNRTFSDKSVRNKENLSAYLELVFI